MKLRVPVFLALILGSILLLCTLLPYQPLAAAPNGTAASGAMEHAYPDGMEPASAVKQTTHPQLPKPADPHARAWALLATLDPDIQAKIDPRLLDEFQGSVLPTHLSDQSLDATDLLGIEKTRFLVYLQTQPSLTSLEDQVFASAADQRQAVLATLVQQTQAQQAPLRVILDAQLASGGVAAYQPFHIVNALAVEGDLMTVIELARRDDVAHIDANYPLQPLWTPTTAPLPAPPVDVTAAAQLSPNWNIDLVEADRVWSQLGVRGEGAVVAGFDTGVTFTHRALEQQYRGRLSTGAYDHNYNWFEPDGNLYPDGNFGPSLSNQPYDCDYYGTHGTHTMGTMVGDGGTPGTRIGMAPEAQWIALPGICYGTMPGGIGDDIGGIKAFQWLLCPTDLTGDLTSADCSKAPDVINNSWGSANPTNEIFRPILQTLRAAGIAPVFASGNPGAGAGSIGTPGNAPEAITVGATNSTDDVASFSGRGPSFYEGEQKPELTAPGVDVLSSVGGYSEGYYPNSGTSMAAPHVAGLIALLVSADLRDGVRDFSVDELEAFMSHTAKDLGDPGPDDDYGFGRINAYNAVRWALSAGDLAGFVRDGSTGLPVEGASITGRAGDGTEFTAAASATGAYSVTVPGGAYTIDVVAWGYAPGTFEKQQVVAGAASVVDFALDALPRQAVTGQVTGQGPVAEAAVFVADNPGIRTTSGADGAFALSLPAGEHTLVIQALGYRRAEETITVGDAPAQLTAELDTAPSILLVDADARYGWFSGWPVYTIFEWALAEHGYTHDLWRIQYSTETDTVLLEDGSMGYGQPSLETLAQYDVVIWSQTACYSGLSGCLGALGQSMVDRLAAYLDGGGHMILSGQNIAYYDDGTPFFDNYVRADLFSDFAATQGDTLTGSGPLDGIELEITNASLYGYANGVFYLSPDAVTAQGPVGDVTPDDEPAEELAPGVSYPLMSYDRSGGSAILASVPCEADYRLLFYPVAYENIGPRADQRGPEIAATLHRSLEWLTEQRPAVSVIPMVDRHAQSGEPGSRISYTLELVNEGSAPAQVNLAVEDAQWNTTIISGSTPIAGPILLPPCERQELEVRIDIPPDGGNGERDETRIIVDVEAGDRQELTLTTTALIGWQQEPNLPGQLWAHGLAPHPDGIEFYTFGGYTATAGDSYFDYRATNQILRYDACRQGWQKAGQLDLPQVSAATVTVGNTIYLIGGYEVDPIWGYSTISDLVLAYDPASEQLETRTSLPAPLAGAAVAAHKGKIYLFGGGLSYERSNTVLVYDTATDRWTELPPLPGEPRYYAMAATMGDRIYLAGDYFGEQSFLAFEPQSGRWSELAELPVPRGAGSLVAAEDGYLYLLGGTSYTSFLQGRVDRYSVADDRWEPVAPLADTARSETQGVSAGGRVYAIGGRGARLTTEALKTNDSFCQTDKAGPGIVLSGGRAAYVLTVEPDTQAVDNISLVDQLPPPVEFVEFTAPTTAVYDQERHAILWQGSVPAGSGGVRIPYTVQFPEQMDADAAPSEYITNTLTVSAADYPRSGSSMQFTRVVSSTVIPADFAASTKRVDPPAAAAGDPVTYTIELRSTTPAGDYLTVTDVLPPTLALVPGTLTASAGEATYDAASRTVSWAGTVAAADDAFVNLDPNYIWGNVAGQGPVPDVEFGWRDISDTGTSVGGGDDVLRCEIPIGFDFPFYLERYSELCVSTNGFVTFSQDGYSNPYNACPIGTAYDLKTIIAAIWDDLVVDDAIYYETVGQAPERALILQWKDVRPWLTYTQGYTNFQLVLHENGTIDLNVLTAGAENGSRSTTGLRGLKAGEDLTYACNQPNTLHNNQTVRFMPPGSAIGGTSDYIRFNAVAGSGVALNEAITNTVVIRTTSDVYTRTATALFNPMSLDESSLAFDRAEIVPGEQVRLTATIRNRGLVAAQNASLSGSLPASMKGSTIQCTVGECAVENGLVTWRGAAPPDEAVEIQVDLLLNTLLPDGTEIPVEFLLDDGAGVTNTLQSSISVIRANLSATRIEMRPAFVEPGRGADLLVLIYNSGRAETRSNVAVTLPPELDYPDAPTCGRGRCSVTDGVLTWEGTTAPRTLVQIRLPVVVPTGAAFGVIYPFAGTITDSRWQEEFALSGTLTLARNTYLPRIHTPDLPDNFIYLPVIR